MDVFEEIEKFCEGGGLIPTEEHVSAMISDPKVCKKVLHALVLERQWNAGYAKELEVLRAKVSSVRLVTEFSRPVVVTEGMSAVFDGFPPVK